MYEYLAHYGIKGQKWGVRRYQNSDGTLTAAGKARSQKEAFKELKKYDSKGIDRSEAVNSKNKELSNAINNGKQYVEKILSSGDKHSELFTTLKDKTYTELTKKFEKQHKRKPNFDEKYEISELVSAKMYNDKRLTNIRKEQMKHIKDYKDYVEKIADDTLGKYKDVVIREIGSHKITSARALDETIWSAAVDDRRQKMLKEKGLY